MPNPYSFHVLLNEQLNDLYSSENQAAEVMPKIIDVTSSEDLRNEFSQYLQEINSHIENLNMIFEDLKLQPTGLKSPPVEGIFQEADEAIAHGGNSSVKDAALIAIIQRLQHYKIAVYGTTRTFARHLNHHRAMEMLQRALNDEGESDRKLTRLAEGGVFSKGINELACKSK